MVITKELQEQLLAHKSGVFIGERMACDGNRRKESFVEILDVGDGLARIGLEDSFPGVIAPCGFLHKESKTFFPYKKSIVLENGPLKTGMSVFSMQAQLVDSLYQEIIDLAFREDGTPNEDEVSCSGWASNENIQEALIALAAVPLFQNRRLTFREFLDKVPEDTDFWLPQITDFLSTVSNTVSFDSALVVKSHLLQGADRSICLNRLRYQLASRKDGFLIRSLSILSHAMRTAAERLESSPYVENALQVRQAYEQKVNTSSTIRVHAFKEGVGSIVEPLNSKQFPERISPLGIVGQKEAFVNNGSTKTGKLFVYNWDEIVWIKRGNAILYTGR